MKTVLVAVTFNGYRPRKDRSCSLSFNTMLEVSSDDIKEYHELMDTEGILIFKTDNAVTEEEIEESENIELPSKKRSKSKLLRDSIYRLWESKNLDITSEEFYDQKMNQIITHIQSQID